MNFSLNTNLAGTVRRFFSFFLKRINVCRIALPCLSGFIIISETGGTVQRSRVLWLTLGMVVIVISGFSQTPTLGDYHSVNSGNWSDLASWERFNGTVWTAPTIAEGYPGQNQGTDDVWIQDGHTITIDVSPAQSISDLYVGQGTSGILQYEAVNARTLTVSGIATIGHGAVFCSASSGTVTTHLLVVETGIINQGTLNFSNNTAGVGITFSGNSNGLFDLSGATLTNLMASNGLVLNKGGYVLSYTPGGIFQVLSGNAVGFLTIQSGTFSLMGTNTFSNPLFNASTGSYTIPSGGGFQLNNPNATIRGMYGTVTNNGELTISSGVYNIGTGSGNELLTTSTGSFKMSGGTMNISGRFRIDGGDCNISGGAINLATVGHANQDFAAFYSSQSAGLTINGNTLITLEVPNSNTDTHYNDIEILTGSGNKTITGGTFQIGTSTTPAGSTFLINSDIPLYNLVVNNTNARISLTDHLTVNNQLSLYGRLLMNNYNLNLGAPAIGGDLRTSHGMILTGTGQIHKTINSTGNYVFPFGNSSNEYLPVTLNLTGGDFVPGASISVGMIPSKHSENVNTTNFLRRYWTVQTTGINNPVYNFTGTYSTNDVVGSSDAWIITGVYTTTTGWRRLSASNNIGTTIYASGLTENADITGINSVKAEVSVTAVPAVVCSGSSVQLTAAATGDAPFTYSWTPAAGLSDPAIYNPVVSPTASTPATITYTVTVTDAMGGSATANTTVRVNPLPIATISGTTDVCQNDASPQITFTGNSGTAPYTFTYRINNGANQTITSAGNTATVAVLTDTPGEFVYSLVSVQDANCFQLQSGTATITVYPLPTVTIGSNSPQCVGSMLNLTASGGTSYSWIGPNGFTSTQQNPSVANVTAAAAGTYTVTVTDANGCEAAASTSVIINPAPSVSITASPGNTICSGSNVTFTTNVRNAGTNPAYQWQVNGVDVPGETSSSFSTTALTNSQRVTVVVTADPMYCSSSATSNIITMTVNPPVVPTVTVRESQNNICAGTTVNFSTIITNGGTSPTYQWQINGSNVPWANSSTFSSSTINDGDQVRVIITSNAPCVFPSTATSNAITMVVNPSVAPSVTIAANPSTSICPGTSVTFTASPTNGGSNPGYQWQVNGTNVGTNSPTFTSSNLVNGDAVSVIMTSNASCLTTTIANSNVFNVIVNPAAPAIPAAMTGNTVVCPNSSATYAIAQVINATTYTWTVPSGWQITSGQGTNSINVTAGNTGQNGSITVTAANTCGTSGARTLAVSAGSLSTAPTGISISNNNTCSGTPKVLTVTGGSLGTGATWQWFTGSCGGTLVGTGPSITVNPASGANTTYYVRASGTCNITDCATGTVIVSPGAPSQPLAISGGASPVCPGVSLTYSIAAVADASSYSWTVPTGWTITNGQGTTSITVTSGSTGQNGDISVIAVNSCGSSTASTLTVSVAPGVPATPGAITGNTDVCVNSTGRTYSVALVPNATSYFWSVPSSGWTITNGQGTNSITVSTNSTAIGGNISVIARNDCGNSQASVIPVNIITDVPPTPGPISGLTAICPVKSVVYSISPVAGAIGYSWTVPTNWTISSGQGTASITAQVPSNAASGNVTVTANNICGQSTARILAVSVANTAWVNAGIDQVVCLGTQTITLNGSVGGAIKANQTNEWDWVVSTGTINNQNSLSSTYTLPNNGNTAGVYTVRIKSNVNAVGCIQTEDEMTITVLPNPTASIAITGNNPVCVGSASTLTFTATPNTTVTYRINSGANQTIAIGTAGTTTLNTAVLTSNISYSLVSVAYTATPACSQTATGSVTITVNSVATVNAGNDQIICAGTNAIMAGSFGGSATSGTWTTSGTGSFSNNTPTAIYTPSAADITAGTVTLTYTTNDPSGPCGSVSDAMVLTINPQATVNAGADQTICAGTNAIMAGSFGGSATSGTWTTSGTGSFSNNTPTAIYTPSAADITAGTVTLTYTTNDPSGPCGSVSDAMVLTINPQATVNAEADQTICASSTVSLAGTISGTSSGTWSGGTGSFTNPASLTTIYTPSEEEIADGTVTLTLTSADPEGPCGIVSDQITVTITPAPTVNAGQDQSICEGSPVVLRGAFGGAATSVSWSGGAGSFSNATSASTTYTPAAGETGDITLTLSTNDPPGSCGPISDAMIVTIYPAATVNAGPDQIICSTGTATMAGSFGGSATSGRWTTSGGGMFNDPTAATAVYTPGNSDIFNGTVTLTYTTDDPVGPCGSVSASMTLTINDAIQITSQPINTGVCATYPADLTVQAIGDNLSYQWYRGTAPGGTAVVNSTNITGAQSASLHFNHATSLDEGTYYVVISGAEHCGTQTSEEVTLNVDQEITITSQFQSNSVCMGEDITFDIVAEPGGLLTFQWRKDGINIPGATGNTLHLENVTLADGGNYDVMIAGLAGYTCSSAQSAAATLTVTPSVEPPVFTLGATSTRCQGAGTVTYATTANNSTGITYSLDAASLAGGNTINATTGAVTFAAGWAGTTTITATATGCNGPATATHTVTITPTVTIAPFAASTSTRCQGAGTITYSTTANNSTGITYSLDAASLAGGNTINATTGAVTFAAGWAGATTITASAAGCNGPVTATHTVTITLTVTIAPFAASTSTRCQGAGTITYSTTASNSTGITYSLDAASLAGGNTINASTGAVTFAAGWIGTTIITASAAGCNGPVTATHTVTVTPSVTISPFLPLTSTRCQRAETITYATTANNSTGITYSLDAASLAGGNTINATTGAVTFAAGWAGTTTITATATGCNGPVTATHTVTITPTVTIAPFAASTSTRCQGAGTVTYSTTASNSTGITYSLDAASLAGGNTINASTGAVTFAAGWAGTTTITASAAGCNGPVTATHTVTITPTVTIAPFAASTSTRCQGAGTVTYSTTASNSTGITYSLDAASLAGGNTINASTGAVTFAAGWSGPTTITARAQGCNGPATTTHSVITDPTSVGGTLSPYNNTVCTTTNSGSLTLSGYNGIILRWESSTNAGANWTTINNTTPSYNFTNLPLTTIFRAVVKSGTCAEVYSAPARVVVIPLFEPIITATTVDVCNGNSTTLSVQTGLLQPVGAFTGGGFNQANPPGWRISENGSFIGFPANANNTNVGPWSETNGPKTFNGISYSNLDGKFAIVNGIIRSTMETPVFNLFGLPSAELTFTQAYNILPGTTARIELSTDGGNTYNIVLATYTGSLHGGNPNVINPVNINMSPYLGMMNLRIRFNYIGINGSSWAVEGISIPSQQTDVTYTWSPAETLSSSTDSVVVATPGVTTTYTLTMMVSGCPIIAKSIVIGVANPPTVQTTNACIGAGPVTFTQTGGTLGGTWRVSGGGTINASTGVFTPATPGCFNASYITPAGTCGDTVSFVVFPAAPTPIVNAGCGPIGITPPAAVPGFTLQYSFDNGITWGGNTPPTAENCTGYQIRTRYITTAVCETIPANTASEIAGCAISTAVNRVVDLTPPAITCPANITASTNLDACYATVTLGNPVVTDNCSATEAITITNNAPAQFPVGVTTVTWTATDACGNQSTCTQTVTITDNNQAPVFTSCPGNQEQTALPNNCALYDIVLTEPVAADNCAVTRLTYTTTGATVLTSPQEGMNYVSGQDLNVGVTTITYIAYDAAGNASLPCSFTVTILDVTPPNLTIAGCVDVEESAAANNCSKIPVTIIDPTYSDDCWPRDSLTLSWTMTGATTGSGTGSVVGQTFNVGVTTVTYKVKDPDGNEATCSFTVTILDVTPPNLTIDGCEDVTESVAADNCSKIPATIIDPTYSDNCWPRDSLTLSWTMTGATTGSGTGSVVGQTFNVGVTTVTYKVEDPDGNEATCSFTVTILRLAIPEAAITCPANPAPVTAVAGTCFGDVIVAPPVEVDPCQTVTYTFENDFNHTDNASGSYPVGTTTVTWTITDNSGRTTNCVQTVVVNDLPPTITCPDPVVVQADYEQPYQDAVTVPLPTYNDNCPNPVLSWVLVPPAAYASEYEPNELSGIGLYPSPSLFYLGITSITYTVMDTNGNTATCSLTVSVLAEPEITCLDGVSYNTDPGQCTATRNSIAYGLPALVRGLQPITWIWTITNPDGSQGATDTFIGSTATPGPPAIPDYAFQQGISTITWRAENVSGFDECTQTVTVTDDQAPAFMAPSTITRCVESILWAVYNPNPTVGIVPEYDDITTPRPEYFLFTPGNTLLDLDTETNDFNDNCCPDNSLTVHWRIDFAPTPNPATAAHEMITQAPVTGVGQPSLYDQDIHFPGDGVSFQDVIHQISYWLIDCNGNASAEQQVQVIIQPRPSLTKITD